MSKEIPTYTYDGELGVFLPRGAAHDRSTKSLKLDHEFPVPTDACGGEFVKIAGAEEIYVARSQVTVAA